jgi:hypothetical protein
MSVSSILTGTPAGLEIGSISDLSTVSTTGITINCSNSIASGEGIRLQSQVVGADGNFWLGSTTGPGATVQFRQRTTGSAGVLPAGSFQLVRNVNNAFDQAIYNVSPTGLTTFTDPQGVQINGALGVYGTAPVAQPTNGIAAAAYAAVGGGAVQQNDTFGGYSVGQIVAALRAVGILA